MSEDTAVLDDGQQETAISLNDRLGIPALAAAATISNVGNGITSLAIPWFVLVTTGSAARTGIAGGLVILATVLSSVAGGAMVDRLGFKRASIFADLLSGVTVAIIPTLYFLDVLAYWHLLVLVFAGAIFDTPGAVARRSLVPGLARRAGMPLERANSIMEFSDQSSRTLLGPLAGGALIGIMGAAAVLYVDAATFAISVIIIGVLVRVPRRVEQQAREMLEGATPGGGESFLKSIIEGFQFVMGDAFLRLVMPISVLYNFILSSTVAVILPVFAREEFDSASALGLMMAAFGAGSAIGTVLYGWRGHQISRSWTLIGSVALIAIAFWILPVSTAVWMGMLATGLSGLAIGPTNVLAITIMQSRVPEEMLGRVLGVTFAFGSAAAPLGVFLTGFLIEITGFRTAMVAAATGTTIAMLWTISRYTIIRQFDDPEQMQATG